MRAWVLAVLVFLSGCGGSGFQAHTVNPRWADAQTQDQLLYTFGEPCEKAANPVVCARTDVPEVWRYCITDITAPLAPMDYKTVECSPDCPKFLEVPMGADGISTSAYVTTRYDAVIDDPSYCRAGTRLWIYSLLQHSRQDVEARLGSPCWFIQENGFEYMLYVGYGEGEYFELTQCKSQDTKAGMLTFILDPSSPGHNVVKVFFTK